VGTGGRELNLMHAKKMFITFWQLGSEVDKGLFVKHFEKRTVKSFVPFTLL